MPSKSRSRSWHWRRCSMNHVLKAAPLSRSENIATYYDPELPLADGLMEPIAGFIERVSRLGEGGG